MIELQEGKRLSRPANDQNIIIAEVQEYWHAIDGAGRFDKGRQTGEMTALDRKEKRRVTALA